MKNQLPEKPLQNAPLCLTKEEIVEKILACKISIISNIKPPTPSVQKSQIDLLEISDYLKLASHQKKSLGPIRWLKMLYINHNGQLKQEDYKSFLMVISQAHYLKLDNTNYYKTILTLKSSFPDLFFSPIEKDIPRTLNNTHPFQSALRNVLIGIAIRNPTLLYCQGMNYLVAYLLINGFTEEETFWFMISLTQHILPADFFKDLGTISLSSLVFNDIVKQIFPQFAKQMQEVGMDTSMFLVSWFICLFSKGFINSVSHYLLSLIILYSRKYDTAYILVCISLGIVAAVLNRQNPFTFESKNFKSFKDNLQTSVYQISLRQIKQGIDMIRLEYKFFKILYNYYKDKREKKLEEIVTKELSENKFILPVCSEKYPVCLHRIEIQKKVGDVEEVNIIRKSEINYINGYFDDTLKTQPSTFVGVKQLNQCLLTRKTHICTMREHHSNGKNPMLKRLQLAQDNGQDQQDLCDASMQVSCRFSTIQERFQQLSGYFVVDPQYESKIKVVQQAQAIQNLQQSNIPSFVASVGKTIKQVINGLKLFKNVKQ